MSKEVQLEQPKKLWGDGRGLKLAIVLTANANKSAPNGAELVPRIFIPLSL